MHISARLYGPATLALSDSTNQQARNLKFNKNRLKIKKLKIEKDHSNGFFNLYKIDIKRIIGIHPFMIFF